MHPAIRKTIVNTALSRNLIALSLAERDYLIRGARIGSFRVPAKAIRGVVGRTKTAAEFLRFKFNLINYDPITVRPSSTDPTYQFISEIVLEGRPSHQTTLYSKLVAGRDGEEQPRKDRRRSISTASDFEAYYNSCLDLIDSIRVHGLVDVENNGGPLVEKLRQIRSVWPNRAGEPNATTIGLAICDDGALIHFTKGHHRLAIAQALDIGSVPIAINYVSGQFFRRYLEANCLFSERRFLNALEKAAKDAVARIEAAS